MTRNILIIKPSSLGDVVHGLPVLTKLRRRYPEARISWLVGTPAAPLVEANPQLDSIIHFRRGAAGALGALKATGSHFDLVRRLAREKFDCVVDLQGLLRSAGMAAATLAPRRIGLSDAREGARAFYTEIVPVERGAHAVDRYLQVGRALDFPATAPEFNLHVADAARLSIERFMGELPTGLRRPYVALSPGTRWPSKDWPAREFAAAASLLQEHFGATIFIIAARSSAPDAAYIERAVGRDVVNMAGRTSLAEMAALLARMDLLITPDTGTMHIADALAVPLVAVFGPTDPARTGPYFQRSNVITAAGACDKAPCLRRDCPGRGGACMAGVAAGAVFAKASTLLEGAY